MDIKPLLITIGQHANWGVMPDNNDYTYFGINAGGLMKVLIVSLKTSITFCDPHIRLLGGMNINCSNDLDNTQGESLLNSKKKSCNEINTSYFFNLPTGN